MINKDIKFLNFILDNKDTKNVFMYFLNKYVNNTVDNTYHNYIHSLHVTKMCYFLAEKNNMQNNAIIELIIAALFHDANHYGMHVKILGLNDSDNIRVALYEYNNYCLSKNIEVSNNIKVLIKATEYPHIELGSLTEELNKQVLIIRDANISQILSANWFELAFLGLAKEWGLSYREHFEGQIKFIENLKFNDSTLNKELEDNKDNFISFIKNFNSNND